jgi:hypothetical protein
VVGSSGADKDKDPGSSLYSGDQHDDCNETGEIVRDLSLRLQAYEGVEFTDLNAGDGTVKGLILDVLTI